MVDCRESRTEENDGADYLSPSTLQNGASLREQVKLPTTCLWSSEDLSPEDDEQVDLHEHDEFRGNHKHAL